MGGPAIRVNGTMDCGKEDPSLGWRCTDAWMSMAAMNEDGTPSGTWPLTARSLMERGHQDRRSGRGSWTLMKSAPIDRAQSAWLYAQVVTPKTVDAKK